MKTVTASLLLAATVITSPALAQKGPHTPDRNAVYNGNDYLGSDPDLKVRFELKREANCHYGC
jgi:hypothetical protein